MIGAYLGGLVDTLDACERTPAPVPTLAALADNQQTSDELRALAKALSCSAFRSLSIGKFAMRQEHVATRVAVVANDDDLMVLGHSSEGDIFAVSRSQSGDDATVYRLVKTRSWQRSTVAESLDEFISNMIYEADNQGLHIGISPRLD